MRIIATCRTIVILVMLLTAAGVEAAPIAFAFTGVVSQDPFLDPDDPFDGTIAFGTEFSGTYVFESTAPDGDASASGGSYTSPGGTLSLTIGGNSFVASDLLNIGIGNVFSGSDFYTVFAQNTTGADPFDVSLFLQDDDGVVFSSALLPTDTFPFASFELATLFLTGMSAGNQIEILGNLTSLVCTAGCAAATPVPEPGTVVLVAIGIGGIAARKRTPTRRRLTRHES